MREDKNYSFRSLDAESGARLAVDRDDSAVLLYVDHYLVRLTHAEARAFAVKVLLTATEAREHAEGA